METDTSLDLTRRTGLPEEFLFLLKEYPRRTWPELKLHESARMWLGIHEWFRGAAAELSAGVADLREGRQEPQAFSQWIQPRLVVLVQHLEGHHQIEDRLYFPAFARVESRLQRGFDLLDRDHHVIHQGLDDLTAAGQALRQATLSPEGRDAVRAAADGVAGRLDALLDPLRRHLHDEEDLVIPMLMAHGDPVQGY